MALIYVVIALLALWGLRLRRPVDVFAGLSVEQSTMIKGLFVLLVFASHVSQYLDLPEGLMTWSYRMIRTNLGQMIVVPFLFFSGYGVRCSINRKGDPYLHTMPRNRILRTYYHTCVILLIFLALQLALGERYSFRQILEAFLLVGSFGNSNWYLFAILYLYIATWLSFRLTRSSRQACMLLFLFSMFYIGVIMLWKERWWYDTVFAYGFGLLFPDLEDLFVRVTKRSVSRIVLCFFLSCVFLALTMGHFHDPIYGILENIRGICLMLLILLILSWFRIGNPVLHWLGTHVFQCYMLQRLPMILLHHFGVSQSNISLFVLGSAVGTVLLVIPCEKLLKWLDRQVLHG